MAESKSIKSVNTGNTASRQRFAKAYADENGKKGEAAYGSNSKRSAALYLKGRKAVPEALSRTRVTVIIPVFNREELTRQCLESLLSTVDETVEIVVVDDMSSDGTPAMLAEFGQRVRYLRHSVNAGFAQSCNDGAKAANGEFLVFLNNDTVAQPGWLQSLEQYAVDHPKATVIGSKLVYPNNTIQHAGVTICHDGYPRHLYAGFPADYPAVNKSRRFQIVTGACMMIRRRTFEMMGGFDTAFRNGFEDVDLCLRLGECGHEIHYCAESVLQHLESVSPGRFKNDRENVALYSKRWIGRVQPDDVRYYIEDGLVRFDYEGRYPLSMEVSNLLAHLRGMETSNEVADLLEKRSREVADLLKENIRLTLELKVRRKDSPELQYIELRQRIREVVQQSIPPDASILVVSKGDRSLLDLAGRKAGHFPQTKTGAYCGFHPASSDEAISHLEELRCQNAQYFLVPATSRWWLEHYAEFREYLERTSIQLTTPEDACIIYDINLIRQAK